MKTTNSEFHYDIAENKREWLWIFFMAGASLDADMTVAASVIACLLLISGDVEENPGPGHGGT